MSPTNWETYLTRFHGARPGITEEILGRCHHDGATPYQWLTDGLDRRDQILDLACGSGPARPDGPSRWLGVDRSPAELRAATSRARGPVARADIAALPLATGSVDVATAAMSLMLVEHLDPVLAEIARVLRPGGQLRMLLPARAPLQAGDRLTYLRLFWAMRATASWPPTPLRRHGPSTLRDAGFAVARDERRRFLYSATTAERAERFVASWYLPHTTESQLEPRRARAARLAPFEVGVPLRLLTATTRGVPDHQPPTE